MKAYRVWDNHSYDGYSAVVWAEDANHAKTAALSTDACEDAEYTDIRVSRLPKLDGMENECAGEYFWYVPAIRNILVSEYGWECRDPDDYECEMCTAKEECQVYQDYLDEYKEEE